MKRSQVWWFFFISSCACFVFFFFLYSLLLFLAFLLGCWTFCFSLQPGWECFLRELPFRIRGGYCHAAGSVVIASPPSITDLVMLFLTNLLPILHEIESPSQHLATRLPILYSHRQRLTSHELATFLPSRACHLPLDTTNRRTTRIRTTSLSNVAVDVSRKRKPLARL